MSEAIICAIGSSCTDGMGAYAIVRVCPDEVVRTGIVKNTTQPRSELRGAIRCIKIMPSDRPLVILTTSEYISKGVTEWMIGWHGRYWTKSSGHQIANADLWAKLYDLIRLREAVVECKAPTDIRMRDLTEKALRAARYGVEIKLMLLADCT